MVMFILIILWIFQFSSAQVSEQWYAFENKAYYVYSGAGINFTNAEAQCVAKHSHLPVITSGEQHNFLKSIHINEIKMRYWLNLQAPTQTCSCLSNSGDNCGQCRASWQWKNGVSITFSNWTQHRPQGGGRQCICMYGGTIGDWDDTSCSNTVDSNYKFQHVCQYDCLNGDCRDHQCTFSNGRYQCICPNGFTGDHCDTVMDRCLPSPCEHNGECVNGQNGYTCQCTYGYNGTHCEIDHICGSLPCKNGGTCARNDITYSCTCRRGYTGTNCETDIDECSSHPCLNGGTCANEIGFYTCNCPLSHNGTNCQQEIDECNSNPCQYGTCHDKIGRYTCECQVGYTGINCESEINECNSDPCRNGTCVNSPGSFRCNCTMGFEGILCDTDINECNNGPCVNNADCENTIGSYLCQCKEGFTGENCETDIDECISYPCQNNGTCLNNIGSYNCTCNESNGGVACEYEIVATEPPKICEGINCFDIKALRIILAATAVFAGLTWIGLGVCAFLDYRNKKRLEEQALVRHDTPEESEETGFHNIASTPTD